MLELSGNNTKVDLLFLVGLTIVLKFPADSTPLLAFILVKFSTLFFNTFGMPWKHQTFFLNPQSVDFQKDVLELVIFSLNKVNFQFHSTQPCRS